MPKKCQTKLQNEPENYCQVTIKDIETADNGAQFYNADLHVHSFGASLDVQDKTMTVEAIIESAMKQKISIIAITDHNTDKNVEISIEYAQKYTGQLLVLAGVEISTANGHLLVYFPPDKAENVRNLLAGLEIVGKFGERDSHTAMSMTNVISKVEKFGGISVAAHIDRTKTGFEMLDKGYPTWKKDIITSSGLLGIEVDNPENLIWYSSEDEKTSNGDERKKILEARVKLYPARFKLATIQGSDAHTLENFLQTNAKRCLTRFKMNELSFEAFRTAIIDSEARIRPIAIIPRSFPRILGMYTTGGFLDGQVCHFSDNLNCFIGGRGTGKSTALQSLAYGLGIQHKFDEYGNCPNNTVIYCQDENGIIYRYERRRGGEPIVRAKDDQSIHDVPSDAFQVEFYGQGDLAEVAKDPLKNPSLLQNFLDKHIRLQDLKDQELELIKRLEENSAQIIPLEALFSQLPEKNKRLQSIYKKLQIAEEGKLKEIVALQSRLAAEKNLLTFLEKTQTMYASGLSLSNFLYDYQDLVTKVGPITEYEKCNAILEQLKSLVENTNRYLEQKQSEINAKLKEFSLQIQKALAALHQVHTELDLQVNGRFVELEKKGLSRNISELQTHIKDRDLLTKDILNINSRKKNLDQLRQERKQLLTELEQIREKISLRRKEQLREVNKNFTKTICDYIVFIHYDKSGIVDDFKDILLQSMYGLHFPEETAAKFCSQISPQNLTQFVANGALHRFW